MAFDKQLRELKEAVLIPLADAIGKHVHPTTISLISFGFGVAAGVAVLAGWYLPGLVLWGINRIGDGLDGTIARRTGRQSDIGGYIDIMLDFTVYAFLPVTFALAHHNTHGDTTAFIAMGFLLSTFYLNAASWMTLSAILEGRNLGAKSAGEKTTITMPTGLIEGAETIVFYSIFFLLPGIIPTLFTLMGVLVVYTIGQRLIWAIANL